MLPTGTRVRVSWKEWWQRAAFVTDTGTVAGYEHVGDFYRRNAGRMGKTTDEAVELAVLLLDGAAGLDAVWPVVSLDPAGPFPAPVCLLFHPDRIRPLDADEAAAVGCN